MASNCLKVIPFLGILLVVAGTGIGCGKNDSGRAYLPRLSTGHIQTVVLKRQQCSFTIADPALIAEIQSALANRTETETYIMVTQTNLANSNFVGGASFVMEFYFEKERPINTTGQLFTFGLVMEITSGRLLGDPDYGHFLFTEKQNLLRQLAQAIQPFLFKSPDSYKITMSDDHLVNIHVANP